MQRDSGLIVHRAIPFSTFYSRYNCESNRLDFIKLTIAVDDSETLTNVCITSTVFDLISEHALISGHLSFFFSHFFFIYTFF